MSDKLNTKETLEYMEQADLVFMVNFKENTQNISLRENVPVVELLTSPFRLSVHLNNLLEASFNEGQTGETVEETPKEDN